MLKLRNKLNKKGGFTLVEMLIVVAIIAILVAVSIPLITGALERTRIATDAANERAAKAEASILYLSSELNATGLPDFDKDELYVYDAANGKLEVATSTLAISTYGKCTTNKHGSDNEVIYIQISEDGEVEIAWDAKGKVQADKGGLSWGTNLCSDEINK